MTEKTVTEEIIVFEFPILWEGWACDSTGWIVQRADGSRYIRMTNHGSVYEAKPDEILERIDKYKSVLNLTYKALALLNEPLESNDDTRRT